MHKAVIELALSTEMDDLPFFYKFGERVPYRLVDNARAQTSAHDHQDRFVCRETGQGESGASFPFHQFLADGASGQDGFLFREVLDGLREVTADLCGAGHAQLIGKAGSQVGFVADDGDMPAFGCHDYRDRDEAALGEDDVGLQPFHQGRRFGEAFDDPEGVGEILPVKVTAEFSGGNAVVGDVLGFDELFLDAVGGADVGDSIACGAQTGQQGNVRRYVTGSAAAGEYNMFHVRFSSLGLVLRSILA